MGLSQAQIERAADARQKLLDAAAQIVLRAGVHTLTLDAVAKEAGISKGGLLHHFPGKADLLKALMDDLLARFEGSLSHFAESDPDPRGRHIRAYVNASVASSPEENRLGVAIITALLFNPALLQQWRRSSEAWLARDRLESSPARASALRLAADGLWLSDAFGLHPFTSQEREDLVRWLLETSRL